MSALIPLRGDFERAYPTRSKHNGFSTGTHDSSGFSRKREIVASRHHTFAHG